MANKITEVLQKVANKYEVLEENGTLYVKVPLMDFIHTAPVEDVKEDVKSQQELRVIDERSNTHINITIPDEFQTIYRNNKNNMYEDIESYLRTIGDNWAYHNYSFAKSILKKSSSHKLNKIVYQFYGSQADELLTNLVLTNKPYIEYYWDSKQH